jgi:ABC-type bacteriocin/lantibiotic exporter with double-glycine peptidase domain
MINFNEIKKKIIILFQKPIIKVIINNMFPIIMGVIGGLYTTTITDNSIIDFKSSFKKPIFYILIVMLFVNFTYNYVVYRYEKSLSRFIDDEYCMAYMRSQLIPEFADSYKVRIKNGEITDLEEIMKNFKKALKK